MRSLRDNKNENLRFVMLEVAWQLQEESPWRRRSAVESRKLTRSRGCSHTGLATGFVEERGGNVVAFPCWVGGGGSGGFLAASCGSPDPRTP